MRTKDDVAFGAAAGLVLGKPMGVLLGGWLVVRLGIGSLPRGVTFPGLAVVGLVAGIGFTMAIFIANLAFDGADYLGAAKIGVLAASAVAAIGALIVGRLLLPKPAAADVPVDEAEASDDA